MPARDGRLAPDACARGFVRAAQYFANILAGADVLVEGRELIRGAFASDFVCFCRRAPDVGECGGECGLPAPGREILRRAVDQVIDTGFMALETFGEPTPLACVVLPISVRGQTEAALLMGYGGEEAVPPHALETLLGVAGLVGATLARQRSDRELVVLAEERAARAVAEQTAKRTRLLAEASEALFASLDCETMLAGLARWLVPQLADVCGIELRDEDGSPAARRFALVCRGASEIEVVRGVGGGSDGGTSPAVARVIATGRSELDVAVAEALLFGPADRGLGLRAMVVPMRVHDRVLGALTLARDGSTRSYGGEDLELAEEVARRAGTAVENARLYRQAREAIRVRDEFLAVASHELKTPLTALSLVVDGAERALGKLADPPAPMLAKVAAISRQARRLNRLVNDLLDVARIQSGRLHMSIEQVDLCAVTREVVARHRLEASAAGCALEVVAGEPVTGAWDGSRVDQVLSNLLSNAIKYGAGKPVAVAVESNGCTALLSVKDHGIGIAPEDRERIFQRFERAVRANAFAGMGLGLWIVQEIVAQLGGSIRVESQLGSGARFTVALPLAPAPARP